MKKNNKKVNLKNNIILIYKMIKNINYINNNYATFDIINNDLTYDISYINALRRIMTTDVNTYCINNKIQIYHNTSFFDNENISLRLSLLPIISTLKIDYSEILITCDIVNNDIATKDIFPSDFIVKLKDTNTTIQNDSLFAYPDMLFCKLKHKQSISFQSTLIRSNERIGGSIYSPTCTNIYTFERDETEIQKRMGAISEEQKSEFIHNTSQRIYKKRNEIPLIYNYKLESIGQLPPKSIMVLGCEVLKDKLLSFKHTLKSRDDNNIYQYNGNNKAVEILIYDENDTLGNLIQKYMLHPINKYHNIISYSGYEIKHPFKNELHFRFATTNQHLSFELYKNEIIDILIDLIDVLIDITNILLNDINKAL